MYCIAFVSFVDARHWRGIGYYSDFSLSGKDFFFFFSLNLLFYWALIFISGRRFIFGSVGGLQWVVIE